MTPTEFQLLLGDAKLYPNSLQEIGGETYGFAKDGTQHYMVIAFNPHEPPHSRNSFSGEVQDLDDATAIKWCLPGHGNARKLRVLFPWTAPQPIGLKRSFGAGDRLGLAAAAHIQAASGGDVALILAQQSIREMTRTQRTPEEVLDAATWGVFQENYQKPWGADADHLKTEDELRWLAATGFTFFTIDPSEKVDDKVETYSEHELESRFLKRTSSGEHTARYLNRTFTVPWEDGTPLEIEFPAPVLHRAVLKYAAAVEHTAALAAVLLAVKGKGKFDLEMSVDETATPTTVAEHFFIANELKQRGVQLQSLALRFVGEFQKGIDYKGDLDEFEARLREHVAIARHLGPYKISIHSGSDKFLIFPIAARVCVGLLHEKTAGTWYLEALRVAARVQPALFREILDFAAEHFAADRATYHVVEDLSALPDYKLWPDDLLESVLDNETGRQMLHVTFGSVLTTKTDRGAWMFRDRIYQLLLKNEDLHHEIVREHSRRHMRALGMFEKPVYRPEDG